MRCLPYRLVHLSTCGSHLVPARFVAPPNVVSSSIESIQGSLERRETEIPCGCGAEVTFEIDTGLVVCTGRRGRVGRLDAAHRLRETSSHPRVPSAPLLPHCVIGAREPNPINEDERPNNCGKLPSLFAGGLDVRALPNQRVEQSPVSPRGFERYFSRCVTVGSSGVII